uniref:hypothetical protein n=1 Tax=Nonomuraea sp. CA-251285 TaxID=3240002 RepID=UPI003F497CEE
MSSLLEQAEALATRLGYQIEVRQQARRADVWSATIRSARQGRPGGYNRRRDLLKKDIPVRVVQMLAETHLGLTYEQAAPLTFRQGLDLFVFDTAYVRKAITPDVLAEVGGHTFREHITADGRRAVVRFQIGTEGPTRRALAVAVDVATGTDFQVVPAHVLADDVEGGGDIYHAAHFRGGRCASPVELPGVVLEVVSRAGGSGVRRW